MGNDAAIPAIDSPLPPLLPLTDAGDNAHPALATVADWVREYLCKPHPELGRNGPVCPFVPGALQKRLLFATIYADAAADVDAVKRILLAEMERFVAMPPTSGNEAQFKSLMVLFPAFPVATARQVIDVAQAQLQRHFVPNGLMVGEFHAGPPPKAGLWNSDFRPLTSPVPMLVIRHMVPTDVLFLQDDPVLFSGYARIYGNAVPERFRAQYEAAAARFGLASAGDDAAQAAPRVIEALRAAATGYRVHRHDDYAQPIRTPQDFAGALGYSLARITKTLFLRCRDSGRHFLLVCGMDRRVDLKGLAPRLDAGRLELGSLADLQRHVGYPPTSVTPIAVERIPVVIDESLMQHATVLTGSGVPRVEIELAPRDLQALCDARVMALS